MSIYTPSVSGLASGIDWRSMIDQLREAERSPIALMESRQSEYSSILSGWESLNTMLLSLKSASESLMDADDFFEFTSSLSSNTSTDASDLLSASVASSSSTGSYDITITALAKAQKLSSKSFSSTSASLGSDFAGDILINGTTISISTTDSLSDVREMINNANAGTNPTEITASIISYGTNDHRLILTSDISGTDGLSLLNASSNDILGELGITETASGSYDVKNAITGGGQGDRFTSVTSTIESLLSLNSPQSSTTLQIQDSSGTMSNNISIDLSTDNLTTIAQNINNNKGSANITASVVSEIVDDTTYYRLQIDGIHASDPFSDNNNVLQTLGLIMGGVGDVLGVTGTNEMATDGQVISTTTSIVDIDGYFGYTAGDQISFSGTQTDGTAVTASPFSIQADSTIQDLLTAAEAAFGDVTASIVGDGNIRIVDNSTSSGSSLNATLSSSITNGTLDFGISSQAASSVRNRQLVGGQDATIEVDGVTTTYSENTVEDLLPGITLNLLKVDASTTVTLNVDLDTDAITEKITVFVESYNEIAAYISEQRSFDVESETAGGPLFGDPTLSTIRSDLSSALLTQISGLSTNFATLGLVGVNLDSSGQLSIDDDTLSGYLDTNPNDVKNLFTGIKDTSVGSLEFLAHSRKTNAGTYTVNITQEATRSTSTSNTSVGGTLGSDETLTITEGTTIANISLTSDMSISDIINTVNTELDSAGIGVTATNDGSDHMVLTREYYGSGSFTISETANLLWTGGDQTVDNGQDVAGTINGEAATGSGQMLTGNTDEANIDGLSIRYAGSGIGDIGTVSLIFGSAELFERSLYSMTDSLDGYVAFKQDSLQETINGFNTRIEKMEDRLDLKMATMVRQFIAMEQALSTMQNQSQWLSSQLGAASLGWV